MVRKVRQSCTFLYKLCNIANLHTEEGHFCALRFWSTLRPLIAWLLLFLVDFNFGGGGGGGVAKKKKKKKEEEKAKPGRKKIQEQM